MNSRNDSKMAKTKTVEVQKLDVDDTVLIDGCFTVDKARWGTWRSFDSEGKPIITSLTEEECIAATRWYLKQRQEGFTEQVVTYDGVVGGKL
jgi:hypothetical protein